MSVIRKLITNRSFNQYCAVVRFLSNNISENYIVSSGLPEIEIPKVTLPEYLYDKCEKYSKYIAFECGVTGRKYTYAELKKKSKNLSKSLRKKLKLEPGDVIAAFLPNIPEFTILALGGLEAGLIITTLNPLYTPEEVSRQLLDSDVNAIVTIPDLLDTVKKACSSIKKTIPILVIKTEEGQSLPNGTIKFDEFINTTLDIPDFKSGNPEDIAFLPYSSGTTGLPKGVELTHQNILSNICQNCSPDIRILEHATGDQQEITPAVLPMFHIYGLSVTVLASIEFGAKIVTLPKFTPELYVSTLENHKPTALFVVPPLVLFLAAHPMVKPEYLSSLNSVMCGAAPLGALDEERLREKIGRDIHILQGYGLTETSPTVSLTSKAQKAFYDIGGSIGRPVQNTLVKIVAVDDKTGTPLGPNQPGELLVKGPQVMKRYHNKPKETTETFLDGWLRTGDLMYYNNNGILFVTDRLKELIKVKGFQVAPAELEEIIRSFPNVIDAAVIGIPDVISGEVPRAYVVAKSNETLNIEELDNYVTSKVATYKKLKGGIEIVKSIPKNASGKIMRRHLKLQYEQEHSKQ